MYSSDDLIWQPYESRLAVLSGATKFTFYTLLQDGTFCIGSEVAYNLDDGYLYLGGCGAKRINVNNFGEEYIYNNLLAENETLLVFSSGLFVEIIGS